MDKFLEEKAGGRVQQRLRMPLHGNEKPVLRIFKSLYHPVRGDRGFF
jgi:hypothetical protein